MNRLRQRLAHIEHAIHPEGRLCAVIDDGSEDIEVRISRCRAETGLSARDLLVIVKRFCGRAPGRAQEPPWTTRRLGCRSQNDPTPSGGLSKPAERICHGFPNTRPPQGP